MSPLTCAGVSAGCLRCDVTTLCHEPRYLCICHTVSHCHDVTLPLVTVTRCLVTVRRSAVRATLLHPRPAAHILLYTSHVTCTPVHLTCHMYTLYMCESMRNISVASSYLRERKQAERQKCLSIYVRSVKYTFSYLSESVTARRAQTAQLAVQGLQQVQGHYQNS